MGRPDIPRSHRKGYIDCGTAIKESFGPVAEMNSAQPFSYRVSAFTDC